MVTTCSCPMRYDGLDTGMSAAAVACVRETEKAVMRGYCVEYQNHQVGVNTSRGKFTVTPSQVSPTIKHYISRLRIDLA